MRISTLVRFATALAITLMLGAGSFAPATPAVAQPETAWERADVLLDTVSHAGGAIIIITGSLSDAAVLPAEVSLAIPKGTSMLWAGEILGGSLDADPTVDYEIVEGEGEFDTVVFTLQTSRIGQVEVDASGLLTTDGDIVQAVNRWMAPQPVASLRLGVTTPQGATVATFTPDAQAQPGPAGALYYTLMATDVPAGEIRELRVEYTAPAGAPPGTAPPLGSTSGGGGTAALFPLVIVGGLLLAGGLLVASRARRRTVDPDTEALDDDEDEDAPQSVGVDAAGEVDMNADDDDALAGTSVTAGPAKRSMAPIILTVGAVLAGIALVIALVAPSGGAEDGQIKRAIAQGKADSTMQTAFSWCGCSPETESEQVFSALRAIGGVVEASIQLEPPVLAISYDSSVTSEDDIQAALKRLGYVQ